MFLSPKLLTFCEMKGAKFLASKFRRCKFFDKSHVCLSTRWPRLILRWGVEDLHWGPTVIKVVMVLSSCHLQRILQMMQPMKHLTPTSKLHFALLILLSYKKASKIMGTTLALVDSILNLVESVGNRLKLYFFVTF